MESTLSEESHRAVQHISKERHPFLTGYMFIDGPTGKIRISSRDGIINAICFCPGTPPIETETETTSIELVNCAHELTEYFLGKRQVFTFPFHQDGTSFQQRVWAELFQISYGKTISYQQLANRLGDPKVIRAAASANGRNKMAIVIPCHRVIGTNGTLVGYAGGLQNKRWLLEHEERCFHGVQSLF
ncbi:MAG: methylated-DNA--[protein]-cysteine S-methyltransferase [Chitinophagaceae bacterium]